jgi:glycosyltransferase involved in cell wall biosynthesis
MRVLESFGTPSVRTNPYITQLFDTLGNTEHVEVLPWSWRIALQGRFDVLHTHWTEALIERRGCLTTVARRALFAAFLLRMRFSHTPIVRTMHNLDLPTGISGTEIALLRAVDKLTSVQIVLSEFTPASSSTPRILISHGHYRDWFTGYARPDQVRGRVVFFGKVRRYKNVEGLVSAFTALPRDEGPYELHVVGSPSSDELVRAITSLAADDPRVDLQFAFLNDADLVREVSESELVALAYHEMHNSGSLLAALSLNRPVLVPDNEVNRALAREVGEDWVLMFNGELTADAIRFALQRARSRPAGSRPDLSRRGWAEAGLRHREAFEAALDARGRRRRKA